MNFSLFKPKNAFDRLPFHERNAIELQIREKIENPETKYQDLKDLLPKSMSDLEAVKTLRKINKKRVTQQIESMPSGYHLYPNSVQTEEILWKHPENGKEQKIKIV
ncbi:MAG: hypothetical protein AAF195_01470, partial [Pseudomonadota bacterium]